MQNCKRCSRSSFCSNVVYFAKHRVALVSEECEECVTADAQKGPESHVMKRLFRSQYCNEHELRFTHGIMLMSFSV